MTQTPVFSSAAEAADLARAGLRYLAAADPTQLTASEQAECLHDLERITAVTTAARANVLGGFTAGQGYCEDADYSPRSWLIHQTRITPGAPPTPGSWRRWPPGRCRSPTPAPCAAGPASSPTTAGTPPTRSWSPPPAEAWTCGTWPPWPPRSSPAPAPPPVTRIRGRPSRSEPSGWRPRSMGPGT